VEPISHLLVATTLTGILTGTVIAARHRRFHTSS
jgi:hypothetical protein